MRHKIRLFNFYFNNNNNNNNGLSTMYPPSGSSPVKNYNTKKLKNTIYYKKKLKSTI